MGKRLIVQRRGRGGSVFKAPVWRRVGDVRYPQITRIPTTKTIGKVLALIHDPGRGAPVALIKLEGGEEFLTIAPEGLTVGQEIEIGPEATPVVGNIIPLGKIPEGTHICNVEVKPGDGGKLIRTSGSYGIVMVQAPDKTIVQLPSGELKPLPKLSRATIGVVAGGGRTEKPLLKAGAKYHLAKAKSWKYPTVRGKAMGAYAHPHGGGSHPTGGRPVSRRAPPGAKVGHIAPKRTGRRKR
ncbi:MAG: 50S ribosomal protein L2 [Candidatus Nezhaarchaeales archaeon]